MGILEKEGHLLVFDTDNSKKKKKKKKKLPTAEIIARLTGKIGANLPTAEGLMNFFFLYIYLQFCELVS